MLNIQRLVNDLFDTDRLNDNKLGAYTADHLIKISNLNPGGIYDVIVADTSNKYQAYYGNLVSEATKKAVREGLSQSMNENLSLLLEKISKIGKLVDYKFSDNQEIYQQFFPLGVAEYYDANLTNINTKLDRLKTAATAHLNVDFASDVTQLNTAITAFISSRNAQLNAFSEEENLSTNRRETRKNLTLQLTFNILTIAANNIENVDRFNNYFNAQYLPIDDNNVEDGEVLNTYEGNIVPGNIIVLADLPAEAKVIIFEVQTETALEIGRSEDGINYDGNTVTLSRVGSERIIIADLNSLAPKLALRNQSNTLIGSYKVTLLG